MSKVYVVNYSGHNVFLANKFGKLVYLTEGWVDTFKTDRVKYEIAKGLINFAKDDYILLCGSPVLNVIAVVVALAKAGECNMLLYNAKQEGYEVRGISLTNIEMLSTGLNEESEVNYNHE